MNYSVRSAAMGSMVVAPSGLSAFRHRSKKRRMVPYRSPGSSLSISPIRRRHFSVCFSSARVPALVML